MMRLSVPLVSFSILFSITFSPLSPLSPCRHWQFAICVIPLPGLGPDEPGETNRVISHQMNYFPGRTCPFTRNQVGRLLPRVDPLIPPSLLAMSHVTATNFFNVTHKALVTAAAVFPTLLIKSYLVTYNLLSAAGWSFVLYRTISHLSAFQSSQPSPFLWIPSFIPANYVPLYQRACTTYDAVGATTASVQTAAVLEILHVLLGFVRSSLATTTIQVASRLFSVWAIAASFPSVRSPRPVLSVLPT